MPSHWGFNSGKLSRWESIAKALFQIALIASLGHPDLKHVWEATTSGKENWLENKKHLSKRITALTVIAGLLIGVTATFITSTPPIQSLLDYHQRFSYYLLLVSFAITLGGLIIGSGMIFVLAKCTANWAKSTLLGTRSRIICTMFIIGYPFIAICVSIALLAAGLVVAAINSKDPLMRTGSTITLAVPVFLGLAFVWTQVPHAREPPEQDLPY